MAPLVLKFAASPRRAAARPRNAIRTAIALLCARAPLDHIRDPGGLEHPMSERSKRLMRNARAGGG